MEPALRASDAERERAVRMLRSHLADGRLSIDEFAERVDRAYAARTVDELRRLVADLPVAKGAPAAPRRRRPIVPGNSPFVVAFAADEPPSEVIDDAVVGLGHALASAGFALQLRTPTQLVFAAEERPLWTIVVAVLAFPFGLLALLHKTRFEITVNAASDGEGGANVEVFGNAPLVVRRAVERLAE